MIILTYDKTLALLPHSMLKCVCGNIERRMYANDGRRSTPTLEGSWLVVNTTQPQKARVFVRQETAVQRIVSFIAQKVASTNRRGSFGEDHQSFINWLFLPATPGILPRSWKQISSIPLVTLPVYDFTHGGRQMSNVASCFCIDR